MYIATALRQGFSGWQKDGEKVEHAGGGKDLAWDGVEMTAVSATVSCSPSLPQEPESVSDSPWRKGGTSPRRRNDAAALLLGVRHVCSLTPRTAASHQPFWYRCPSGLWGVGFGCM